MKSEMAASPGPFSGGTTSAFTTLLARATPPLLALIDALVTDARISPFDLPVAAEPIRMTRFLGRWRVAFAPAGELREAILEPYEPLLEQLLLARGGSALARAARVVDHARRHGLPFPEAARIRLSANSWLVLVAVHNWLWLAKYHALLESASRELIRIAPALAYAIGGPRTPEVLRILADILVTQDAEPDRIAAVLGNFTKEQLEAITKANAAFQAVPEFAPPAMDLGDHADPPASRIDRIIADDIEPLLLHAFDTEGVQLGDLFLVHELGNWIFSRLGPEPQSSIRLMRIEGTDVGQIIGPTPGETSARQAYPRKLAHIPDVCRFLSPISRLLLSGLGVSPAAPLRDNWPGLGVLLRAPEARGLRQYLASRLGEALLSTSLSSERLTCILALFNELPVAAPEDDGARTWLLTLIAAAVPSRVSDRTVGWDPWRRWTEPVPGLAFQLGQLARDAERDARGQPSETYSELVWQWNDLARVTLSDWLSERGHATLCLGQWLEGFFTVEGSDAAMPVASKVCGFSMFEIVSIWVQSVRVAKQAAEQTTPLVYHTQRSGPDVALVLACRDRLALLPNFKPAKREAELLLGPEPDAGAPATGLETKTNGKNKGELIRYADPAQPTPQTEA